MKRLYFMGAMALMFMSSIVVAQKSQTKTYEFSSQLTSEITNKTKKHRSQTKGSEIVFWGEDFSNGFDGQGDNGAWTTDGDQGDLWFQTFPAEISGGYDPNAALQNASGEYGTQIPNYFGSREVVSSPTRDNGVMMIDADRWNSTSTEEEPEGTLTDNPLAAGLISPVMDLSASNGQARLVFNQYARLCCNDYSLSVRLSIDGGETYAAVYDVFNPYGGGNDELDIEVSLCLVEALSGVSDLSNIRLKFAWDGGAGQSHYFWMLDDIRIVSIPENDIDISTVYYQDHPRAYVEAPTYADYYQSLEYQITPSYLLKPITIGAIVGNRCSQNTQTGVKVNAVVTAPDASTQTITTEMVDLAPGEIDTLYSEPTFLDAWGSGDDTGEYTISYEAIQNETDDIPDNNIGDDRTFLVTSDMTEAEPYAIMQNGGESYDGAFNQDYLASDAIINNPYTFEEPLTQNAVITHVEVVFLYSAGFAETVAGEFVYFNVREGAILDEDETDPSTITSVFFQPDEPLLYDDSSLEYEIQESDIWQSADGFPQTYVSFELPNPIMIEPGVVYSAEVRIPSAGSPIVFFPVSSSREEEAVIGLYNFNGDNPGWGTSLGPATPSMRFRTASVESVDKVTYESGVQLLQNYPNPFRDLTRIQYRIDETSDVTFEVFDISGRLVYEEDHGTVPAGIAQTFNFDAKDFEAGVYTYSIVANGERVSRKLIIE